MKVFLKLSMFMGMATFWIAASIFLLGAYAGAAEFSKEAVLKSCSTCHSECFLAGH